MPTCFGHPDGMHLSSVVGDAPKAGTTCLDLSTLARDVEYRIEGAHKMVFGIQHSTNTATTITNTVSVCKMLESKSSLMWAESKSSLMWAESADVPKILTLHSIRSPAPRPDVVPLIRKFIPARYLMPCYPITLPRALSARLVTSAQSNRPDIRMRAPYVAHDVATIHPDAARYFGDATIMVEFKAKGAHLARSKLIPPHVAQTLRKYSAPAYHIKNYLVPQGGGEIPQDVYNPGDLLGGEVTKMRNAAQRLCRERSRTLRVFRKQRCDSCGDEIFFQDGKESRHVRGLVDLAVRILANDETAVKGVSNLQNLDSVDALGAVAAMDELGRRLGGGKEEAMRRVNAAVKQGEHESKVIDKFVDGILYKCAQEARDLHNEERYKRAVETLCKCGTEVLCAVVARFLVAAIAKDCSLLVAMCKQENVKEWAEGFGRLWKVGKEGKEEECAGEWVYRIWVVDVDEKDVRKIYDKWQQEDLNRTKLLSNSMQTCIVEPKSS